MKMLIVGSPNTFESEEIQKNSKDFFDACDKISLSNLNYQIGEKPQIFLNQKEIIDFYDVFLLRGVSKNLSLAFLIALLAYQKEKCIIDEKYVTKSNLGSKLSTIAKLKLENVPVPKTIAAIEFSVVKDNLKNELGFPLIFKPAVGGRKGKNVYKIENEGELEKIVKKHQKNLGRFLFQEYIPNLFDIRIIVIGGKALGAMKRVAPKGDFRSNIALGGHAEFYQMTTELKEIAEKAARAVSDEIAGVDIMIGKNNQPYVIEVNRTPQFRAFAKVTKINVGRIICEYAFNKAKSMS